MLYHESTDFMLEKLVVLTDPVDGEPKSHKPEELNYIEAQLKPILRDLALGKIRSIQITTLQPLDKVLAARKAEHGPQDVLCELRDAEFELDKKTVIPFLNEWWAGYEILEVTRLQRLQPGDANYRKSERYGKFQYEVDYRSDRSPAKQVVARTFARPSADSGFPDGPNWGRGRKGTR